MKYTINDFVVTEAYDYLEYTDATFQRDYDGDYKAVMELTLENAKISVGDIVSIEVHSHTGGTKVIKEDKKYNAFPRLNKESLTISVVKEETQC